MNERDINRYHQWIPQKLVYSINKKSDKKATIEATYETITFLVFCIQQMPKAVKQIETLRELLKHEWEKQ